MNWTNPVRIASAVVFGLLITSTTTPTIGFAAAGYTSVIGTLEGIDQAGNALGWAQDVDTPAMSIEVHLYMDGPAGGGGTFLGIVTASIPRSAQQPGAGNHGFQYPIPSRYRDGAPHTLHVYGIDSAAVATENAALAGAPLRFVLQPTVIRLQNSTIRFGVEPRCGGTLVELGLVGGPNLVNNFDCTGRQIQAAMYDANGAYDSCAGCLGIWDWDPVQGGDRHNAGSPLIAQSVTNSSVYSVTQPYEWFPDNKGGGPGRPVLSDVTIEQTASFVPGYPNAVRLHYRIHHFGADHHGTTIQEFPAVFANAGYDYFVTYGGTKPWTGAAVTTTPVTPADQYLSQHYLGENWASFVDQQGNGVTVYVPQQYPYGVEVQMAGSSGEYGSGSNYFRPHVPFTFGPGSVLDAEIYVIAGDYRNARRTIQALHALGTGPDPFPPFGGVDQPTAGQTLSGSVVIGGWTFDNSQLSRVEVLVDGQFVGTASYGSSRPDVAAVYPNAPADAGFSYRLDTTQFGDGQHQLVVTATDLSGNVAILANRSISTRNTTADTIAPVVTITGLNASRFGRYLTVKVQASDNVGVRGVRLYRNNQLVATDTTAPYEFVFNPSLWSAGTYQFVATAADAAGNIGTSLPVQYTKR